MRNCRGIRNLLSRVSRRGLHPFGAEGARLTAQVGAAFGGGLCRRGRQRPLAAERKVAASPQFIAPFLWKGVAP